MSDETDRRTSSHLEAPFRRSWHIHLCLQQVGVQKSNDAGGHHAECHHLQHHLPSVRGRNPTKHRRVSSFNTWKERTSWKACRIRCNPWNGSGPVAYCQGSVLRPSPQAQRQTRGPDSSQTISQKGFVKPPNKKNNTMKNNQTS